MNIPIFLASDDNYAPFLCTTLYSILENTGSVIEFYVLDGGISENSKNNISLSLQKFKNYSLEYIDMSKFDFSQFPNMRHYSLNTFSRYFIPVIKPNLDKVIYIDVDVIVKKDIRELYSQDLGKYFIGAVLEDFFEDNYTYLKEKIYRDYKSGCNYFNAGVLLLSLEYFRKNNLTEKLISMTAKYKDTLRCPDQDIFNIMFENNFLILDYRFNFMPDYFYLLEKKYPSKASEIRDNAAILHYVAGKPWKNKSIASFDFWIIAKNTHFYEKLYIEAREIQKKLKYRYFFYKILSKIMFWKAGKRYEEKCRSIKIELAKIP